jgi:molybdopterin converting factor small subunit
LSIIGSKRGCSGAGFNKRALHVTGMRVLPSPPLGITFILYAVDSVLMKVKVRLFGDVAEMVGSKHSIELKDDSTILSLTNRIQRETGHSRGGYLGEFKVGGPDLAIMVNGKNIQLLDGLQTKLCEEDDIVIMPFVVGG